MKELIERLRFHNDPRLYQEADLLMYDAANLIESQAAKLEAACESGLTHMGKAATYRRKCAELEAQLAGWKQDQKENLAIQVTQHQEILKLKSLCDQLGAALDSLAYRTLNTVAVDEALAAWRASQC